MVAINGTWKAITLESTKVKKYYKMKRENMKRKNVHYAPTYLSFADDNTNSTCYFANSDDFKSVEAWLSILTKNIIHVKTADSVKKPCRRL